MDGGEAEKEGGKKESKSLPVLADSQSITRKEERKRMCGNDAREREMMFDGKRIKDRSIERSGILGCQTDTMIMPRCRPSIGFGPFVPFPLA